VYCWRSRRRSSAFSNTHTVSPIADRATSGAHWLRTILQVVLAPPTRSVLKNSTRSIPYSVQAAVLYVVILTDNTEDEHGCMQPNACKCDTFTQLRQNDGVQYQIPLRIAHHRSLHQSLSRLWLLKPFYRTRCRRPH
jgi:hypothetical protein